MLPHNLWLITRREYLKVVRKKSFWISTLIFPVLMIVIVGVTAYSTRVSEETVERIVQETQRIVVVDESGWIDSGLIGPPFELSDSRTAGIAAVESESAEALIYYPPDMGRTRQLEVHLKSRGLIHSGRYNELAQQLLRSSLLQQIGDPEQIAAVSANYQMAVTAYRDGDVVDEGIETLLLPVFSLVAFFLMTSFGVSYFLMSVSEEKENRMMEIVLSMVRPASLVWGKILGLLGVVLTQFALLGVFAAVIFSLSNSASPLPVDLSRIDLSFDQVAFGLFYLIGGYLFLAGIMVGVGAVMPNYKDAQSFSSVFIVLSILPLYLLTAILTDTSSVLARTLSYLPFTSPLVLLLRNALGELPWWEKLLSVAVVSFYVWASFVLAFKLFMLGALEYNDKISWKRLLGRKP